MVEGGKIFQPSWGFHEGNKGIEVIETLHGALASKDNTQVQKILQDPQALETLIIDRGKNNRNIEALYNSFDLLFKDKFGSSSNIFNVDEERFVEFLHEYDIPEDVLAKMISAAYHQKDDVTFFRLISIVLDNENLFQDKGLISKAKHHLASWESSREDNKNKAIALNKEVIQEAEEQGDKVLVEKARFGLAHDKDLRPGQRVKDYKKVGDNMEALDHLHDAYRAKIEEAKARLEIIEAGSETSDRAENINEVENLAIQALEYADKSGYRNLGILASEVLSRLYKIKGDKRKGGQFDKKAQERRNKFGYHTK